MSTTGMTTRSSSKKKAARKTSPWHDPEWQPPTWAYGEDFGEYATDTNYDRVRPTNVENVKLYDVNIKITKTQLPPVGFLLSDAIAYEVASLVY
jgi:hypothetical protein